MINWNEAKSVTSEVRKLAVNLYLQLKFSQR